MEGFNEALYCDAVAIFCAGMTLLNLSRAKTRGPSAYILALAFLVLGGTVLLYAAKGISPLIWAGGACVVILLIADIVYRTGRGSGPGQGGTP